MLRPGSADASHERIFQTRLCQNAKKRHHQVVKETLDPDPLSSFSDISVIDGIAYRSITDLDGMPAQEPLETLTPENSSDSRNSVDQVESNVDTNNSSRSWGLGNASSALTAELGYVWTPHNVQELRLRSDQVQTALLTSDDPFMGAIGNESLDHLLPRLKEIETGATVETATELCLANDDVAVATQLSHDHHYGPITTDESALIPLAPQPLELSSANLTSRSSPRSIQLDKRSNDTNQYKDNHITIHDSGSRQSDLRALIDRITKSSHKETDIIEELITTFSISAGSTPIRSLGSSHPTRPTQPPVSAPNQSYLSYHDLCLQSSFVFPVTCNLMEGYLVSGSSRSMDEQKQWISQPLRCNGCLPIFYSDRPHFWYNQNVGWSDKYGNTSLHVATALGACFHTLFHIIRSGVDVRRTNTAGQTFWHVSRQQDDLTWNVSISEGTSEDTARRRSLNQWCKLLTELKERDYNFNHGDDSGQTVWNLVSLFGRTELSFILESLGINSNLRWVEPRLINHIRSSDSDSISGLLDEGININQRDEIRQTPLHLSIQEGLTEITRTLLSHGPNLHARDFRGNGVLAGGRNALRRAKSDASKYARITACMTLAIDAGAIAWPTSHLEWTLPNYQHWLGDPTQPEESLHGSWSDIQN